MIRRPPRSTHCISSAASDVYKRQHVTTPGGRYMRLVTPLRAPFAAPIAPSHRGEMSTNPPPRHMVPPVRSPRSTAVCEDLSPFVCELRKRSKIVPKVTRGNSRPGTPALPRNTAVSDIQQQPRAASWGRVEYMSDPARGLLSTLAFSGSRSHTSPPWCEWLPVRLWD